MVSHTAFDRDIFNHCFIVCSFSYIKKLYIIYHIRIIFNLYYMVSNKINLYIYYYIIIEFEKWKNMNNNYNV